MEKNCKCIGSWMEEEAKKWVNPFENGENLEEDTQVRKNVKQTQERKSMGLKMVEKTLKPKDLHKLLEIEAEIKNLELQKAFHSNQQNFQLKNLLRVKKLERAEMLKKY